MKKLAILLASLILICSLSAKLMQPLPRKTPIELSNISSEQPTAQVYREAPEFGGVYLVYHARETASATRRVYFSYIDETGQVTTGTIDTEDIHEGYAGIDIDPVSGDAFVTWHQNSDGSGDLEVAFTNSLFHLGSPCGWTTPFGVITNFIPSPNGMLDEFIWPTVHIGASPIFGKRRVYVQAKNSYSASDPSENVLIAYTDFDTSDLAGGMSILDWEYLTVPFFDNWNQANPVWIRPFHSFDVSKVDGRIAFFGYNTNDEVYICYNNNYGNDFSNIENGGWIYRSEAIDIDTWNPQYQNGTYTFTTYNGDPYELIWAPINSGHMTSSFYNGSDNMAMQINMGLQTRPDASGSSYYYPYEIFPYNFSYDFETEEFHFIIANPLINENANNPNYEWPQDECYIPWDTDNDGEVDEYDDDGNVIMFNGWPIWFWDNDVAFHENLTKVTINDENGWIAHVWMDGLKNKYYNDGGDENYIDWAETAEIYISISNNGGESWSDPIIMNAKSGDVNYCEEFAGMKPCYIYPGDKIEDLGDGWGLVHLMFLDDYSFGSSVQGHGGNLGGMMEYATLIIDFDWNVSAEENGLTVLEVNLQNYPNPFNPSTTISFELNTENIEDTEIIIYNLKGQKIKQFQITNYELGINEIIWDGKDEYGKLVSSGVYFYQLKLGDEVLASKKCLLLK